MTDVLVGVAQGALTVAAVLLLLTLAFAAYFFWCVPQKYRRWEAIDRARRVRREEEK